jgi:hypothetical protein
LIFYLGNETEVEKWVDEDIYDTKKIKKDYIIERIDQ